MLASPAFGQTRPTTSIDPATDLEPMVDATSALESGLALAQRQTESGALLSATATLERLLLIYPESDLAVAMHATLLCRLDDISGGKAELDVLKARGVDALTWSDGEKACTEDETAVSQGAA